MKVDIYKSDDTNLFKLVGENGITVELNFNNGVVSDERLLQVVIARMKGIDQKKYAARRTLWFAEQALAAYRREI